MKQVHIRASLMHTATKVAKERGRATYITTGETPKGYGYIITDQRPEHPLYVVEPDGSSRYVG